jgi:hypothetical protein
VERQRKRKRRKRKRKYAEALGREESRNDVGYSVNFSCIFFLI